MDSDEYDGVIVIDPGVPNNPEGFVSESEENNGKVKAGKPFTINGKIECVPEDSPCSRFEIDVFRCSICMEVWTSSGEHHISCLPCGHIFGLSCIKKWIRQKRGSSKCPQCNSKCALKDVRKLFAPAVAAIDEDSQKLIQFLEEKCAFFERQQCEWRKKESHLKEINSMLQKQVDSAVERARNLESVLECYERRSNQTLQLREANKSSSIQYSLKAELEVVNGRLFDINASEHLLVARRPAKNSAEHVLTKINISSPSQREDIPLPNTMKFLKDLRVSPMDTRVVLCASLGKRLLLLNTETRSVVISYDLPAAAWSCCWDLNDPNYVFTGLQNGAIMEFDVRQSVGEIGCSDGLSNAPIHSVHSLPGSNSAIFASSSGFGQWSTDDDLKKVDWIQEAAHDEVCISLACSASDIVATFRPRVDFSGECNVSQTSATPPVSRGIQGCYRHFRGREGIYEMLGGGHAAVSDVRLPKTVVIDWENRSPVFAAVDEQSCGLVVRELPSFALAQRLKLNRSYIFDVKCCKGVLGCLTEETLQIYSPFLIN